MFMSLMEGTPLSLIPLEYMENPSISLLVIYQSMAVMILVTNMKWPMIQILVKTMIQHHFQVAY